MTTADSYSSTLPMPATASAGKHFTFTFDCTPIRIGGTPDAPLFVAIDVCAALGIAKHRDACGRLDRDERGSVEVDTPGGRQSLAAVTEGGLYTLIIRSRCASSPGSTAHRFRRWVTGKVMPEIRKTGSYQPAAAPAPLAIDVRDPRQLSQIALQLLQVNQEQARELCDLRFGLAESETRHALNAPKLEAYEAFLDDEGLCCLRSAARAIEAPVGDFFVWLRARGWLVDEEGWAQPGWERRRDKHFVVRHHRVGGIVRGQTYVTRAGLVFLRDRWQAKLLVDARETEAARLQSTLDL